MKRLLTNWEIKVLAVLAAIIFWFLVVGTENNFYTFPEEIPIKTFNLSEDLVVADNLKGVTVRLKIENRDVIKNLSVEDFNAYIDLEGLTEGEREAEVIVSSKKSDVSVMKVEPSTVKVKIEQKSEKEVPVSYELTGDVAEGYEVKEVLFGQENALIKGPQKIISEIDNAKATIELKGESEDFKQSYVLQVFDNEGAVIENIGITPQEVEAEVKIALTSGQKLVGVQPNIIGEPKDNFWIKSINVDPPYIVLAGDAEKIRDIEFVQTEEINVNDLTETTDINVNITGLPEDVNSEVGEQVKVTIEIEKIGEEEDDDAVKQKSLNIPVVIKKFRDDQEDKSADPPLVTIVAEGTEGALNKLSSTLKVELDISGYTNVDEVTLEIDESKFKLPEGVSIVSVNPSSVKVEW